MATRPRRSSAPRQVFVPEYHHVTNLLGGMRTDLPPEQIADDESPNVMNMVWNGESLTSDTGYVPVGKPIFGKPLHSIIYKTNNGTTFTILVADSGLYYWGGTDWTPVYTGVTMTTTAIVQPGSGGPATIALQGPVVAFHVGDLVSVPLTSGKTLTGHVVVIDTATVTIGLDTVLATTESIPAASVVHQHFPITVGNQVVHVSWVVDPVNDWLIINDGVDPPIVFDGVAATVFPLPGISAIPVQSAAWVTRFHGQTIFMNVKEGGVNYPYRVRRSATGDSTNWTTLDSGFDDLDDTNDPIRQAFIVGPYLAIFRDGSIMRATYYGAGLQVLYYEYTVPTVGLFGIGSAAVSRRGIFLVSEQGIFLYLGDYSVTDAGEKIFNSFFGPTGDSDPVKSRLGFAQYEEFLDSYWFFYQPVNGTSTNKVLRFFLKKNSWFPRKFADDVSASGFFLDGSVGSPTAPKTWADLQHPWGQSLWPWNSRARSGAIPLVLLGSPTGQMFVYDYFSNDDGGVPIEWFFVTKDFVLPETWEDLDGVILLGRGGVCNVEVSLDGGFGWMLLGSLDFGLSWSLRGIDVSITNQTFRFRFSGIGGNIEIARFSLRHMVATEGSPPPAAA